MLVQFSISGEDTLDIAIQRILILALRYQIWFKTLKVKIKFVLLRRVHLHVGPGEVLAIYTTGEGSNVFLGD